MLASRDGQWGHHRIPGVLLGQAALVSWELPFCHPDLALWPPPALGRPSLAPGWGCAVASSRDSLPVAASWPSPTGPRCAWSPPQVLTQGWDSGAHLAHGEAPRGLLMGPGGQMGSATVTCSIRVAQHPHRLAISCNVPMHVLLSVWPLSRLSSYSPAGPVPP